MSQMTMSWTFPANVLRAVLRRAFGIVLLGAVATVLAINLFFQRSLPADPSAEAARLQQANLPVQAETVLQRMLLADPLNLDLNYRYINNHFAIPPAGRDDASVESYYQGLTNKASAADVGHYGLGLIAALQHNYRAALDEYLLVANHDQKYLNNSIGRVYVELGDEQKAENYLRREIALRGNIGGAVGNLSTLYIKQNQVERIRGLVDDPLTGKFVASGVRRYLALRTLDVGSYAQLVFLATFERISLLGVLSALLICAMWFLYFWRIDVFEQEPLTLLLAALLMGAAAALTSTLLSDTFALFSPVNAKPTWSQELLFAVWNIGVVEEVVKFVPVLLIVLLSGQINEPLDLLIYGGMSALGFATLENSLYFTDYGLGIVFTRFLMSTVMHLGLTGIICYAWARARYLRPGNQVLAVVGGLVLAACVHGLFDYFILRGLQDLTILSLGIMILMAWVYSRMIKDCLVHSPFFDQARATSRRLSNYSLLASTAILTLLIAFLYNNFNFSTEIANGRLVPLGWAMALAGFVVLRGFGSIRLISARLPRVSQQIRLAGSRQQELSMESDRLIWGMTWRGSAWGSLMGAVLGGVYGALLLFILFYMIRFPIPYSTPTSDPAYQIGSSIGVLLVALLEAAISGFFGLLLGLVGGALCGIMTRLFFQPLRDMRGYRWVVGVTSAIYGFMGILIGFVILTLMLVAISAPAPSPTTGASVANNLGFANDVGFFLIGFCLVPPLLGSLAAVVTGQFLAGWYSRTIEVPNAAEGPRVALSGSPVQPSESRAA